MKAQRKSSEGGHPLPEVLNVSDPWFEAIARGQKTVEGRLATGRFADMKKGTQLVIRQRLTSTPAANSSSRSRSPPVPVPRAREVNAVVTRKEHYANFRTYLEQEGLARTLPGVPTVAEGVRTYRQFYSAEREKEHGVCALHIKIFPKSLRETAPDVY